MTRDAVRPIWVYLEQERGDIHPVAWELLGAARRLAEALPGARVEGVLLGHAVERLADAAFCHGAERVILIDDPALAAYRNTPYAFGIATAVRKYAPDIFLVGATTLGRDLASAVATRVKTGLTADCTELSIDPEKKILAATRPTFGGNLMATILCRTARPQMATVRPRVLPAPRPVAGCTGEVVREPLGMTEDEIAVKLLRFIPAEHEAAIESADIVVAGGRGVGGKGGFAMLATLADALGGVVGASRPAVDAGWISYPHQVGQTGKTIRPRLYVAAGISGALQHRVGVLGSDFILAINIDPGAPIFSIADFGIVGDLYAVIPELTRQVRTAAVSAGGLHA